MNEKIEINADLTPEDYADALIAIQTKQNIVRVFGIALLFISLTFLVFLYFVTGPEFLIFLFNSSAIFFIFALGLLWLIVFKGRAPKFLTVWNVKRQFKTSPALRELRDIVIDEEGLSGNSVLSSATIKWGAFIEATETQRSFLFYTSKKFAQFIPKRFLTPQQEMILRNLAKQKMGDRAKSLL